jgi:hypothetical protein
MLFSRWRAEPGRRKKNNIWQKGLAPFLFCDTITAIESFPGEDGVRYRRTVAEGEMEL